MEEESLSSTITSFSTLSPQTNYQTLIDRENMANNYVISSASASASSISVNSSSMSSSSNSSISPNLINSSCSDASSGYPYAIFIFRPNNGNNNNNNNSTNSTTNNTSTNGTTVGVSVAAVTGANNTSMNTSNNNNGELFEERRIALDKPCKIGRSVAKLRPEPNNAIFDCKVLSRNHALLWEETGKVRNSFFVHKISTPFNLDY